MYCSTYITGNDGPDGDGVAVAAFSSPPSYATRVIDTQRMTYYACALYLLDHAMIRNLMRMWKRAAQPNLSFRVH